MKILFIGPGPIGKRHLGIYKCLPVIGKNSLYDCRDRQERINKGIFLKNKLLESR